MINKSDVDWNAESERVHKAVSKSLGNLTGILAEESKEIATENEIILYSLGFLNDTLRECAIEHENGYIIVQECTEGYDYTIASKDFQLIDGGIYDNPDVSIICVLNEALKDAAVTDYSTIKEADYEFVAEQIELAEKERFRGPEVYSSRAVIEYKVQTQKDFSPIGHQNADDVEETVSCYIQSIIDECGLDAEIVGLAITGSRSRGIETEESDLDIVVELKSSMKEDVLFNIFNEDKFTIAGVRVDINPIVADKTGTLESYLADAEKYLADKKEQLKIEVTKELEKGNWVDTDKVQRAFGLSFKEAFSKFDFSRTAEWWSVVGKTDEERARNGQKINTCFRLKQGRTVESSLLPAEIDTEEHPKFKLTVVTRDEAIYINPGDEALIFDFKTHQFLPEEDGYKRYFNAMNQIINHQKEIVSGDKYVAFCEKSKPFMENLKNHCSSEENGCVKRRKGR